MTTDSLIHEHENKNTMNREIKFRGIDKETGEWVYGSLVNNLWLHSELTNKHGQPVCEILTGKYKGDCWEDIAQEDECIVTVHEETVGQFMGLKDKKGVDIYEGDMVKHNDNTFVVCWRDNMGACFVDMKRFDGGKDLVYNKDNWRDWLWVYHVKKYIEVIGNVHEIPKLANQ